ncbi:signal peptidase I [Isachenkonia alkalipeptolytica]|uniref:Signal peptidase I n=1 Tax=Isachenkonia alkalipeptolytica TaxID=2565777 RepID=A0AA43XLU8_9CLOT|nr:signal peptidase I [Isachenkonia alkalipeptolytica]NBG89163.1 signal peptidase I [Isachenkonia alkalipeptolytica]
MKKEILEWVKTIIISLIIALIITTFMKPTIVKHYSMQPTLDENDFLIINRLLYTRGTPERGDIIVFESNQVDVNGDAKLLIKRIIALPGEEISIRGGQVYIDDELLTEPYLEDDYTHGNVHQLIPEDKLFVMGDHRNNSLDSRNEELGLINFEDVVGKAFVRLYPFSEIGSIE